MTERTISNPGLSAEVHADGLSDSGTLELEGADTPSGTCEATGVIYGGACDIEYLVRDSAGSVIVSVTLYSPTGAGVKPLSPAIPCSSDDRTSVRVTNTSGGAADYAIIGYEVDD